MRGRSSAGEVEVEWWCLCFLLTESPAQHSSGMDLLRYYTDVTAGLPRTCFQDR